LQEVIGFQQRRIDSNGLLRGRFVHEEVLADALSDRPHQKRRDAVPDPDSARVPTSRIAVFGQLIAREHARSRKALRIRLSAADPARYNGSKFR